MLADTGKRQYIEIPGTLTPDAIADFLERVNELLQMKVVDIAVDCSKLDRVTSTHVNVLWTARSMCAERNANLRLENVDANFLRVLEILDLAHLFSLQTIQANDQRVKRSLLSPEDYGAELQLKFSPTAEGIASAMRKVRHHMVARGVCDRGVVEVETIFYETATNIRLHSGLKHESTVTVTVRLEGKQAMLEFRDEGIAFDPTRQPDNFDPSKAINRRQNHGIGVTLIKRMTERIEYKRENGQFNVLTLQKRLECSDG